MWGIFKTSSDYVNKKRKKMHHQFSYKSKEYFKQCRQYSIKRTLLDKVISRSSLCMYIPSPLPFFYCRRLVVDTKHYLAFSHRLESVQSIDLECCLICHFAVNLIPNIIIVMPSCCEVGSSRNYIINVSPV